MGSSHQFRFNGVSFVGLPWIRGPGETKKRKVGEEDGPLAERDKPL